MTHQAILILDEATSALASDSEASIMKNMHHRLLVERSLVLPTI
ncbi:MAG: hypothetical protein AB8W37_05490 [Arsenophonus endosymbiont of Dermacentor nuttalli]